MSGENRELLRGDSRNELRAARMPEPAEPMCESDSDIDTYEAKEITIKPVNYGYIVKVGCQTFAIEGIDKLITNLTEYLKNPRVVEKKWFKGRELL